MQPIQVIMEGKDFEGGEICEGDFVEVPGDWVAGGTYRTEQIKNITSGRVVRCK